MAKNLVAIDGSILEGGGQIIRNALSFSILTNTPIRITNIRAGREKPGLMEQHLKGLQLVKEISNAKVNGCELHSTEIEFRPSKITGGNYNSFVKTAGSISLLMQVSLPCALFANDETTMRLQGGTNAEMAPQIDYITEVFRPVMEKFGASFDFDLTRRGYFPKGGGEVTVKVKPVKKLNAVDLTDQGEIKSIYGWSFVAGTLPIHMATAMANSATSILRNTARVDIEKYKESPEIAPVGNCSGIILVAETSTGCLLGGSALGKREERAEETGTRAAEELLSSIQSGSCVDSHCQDQIIILMALAEGKSRIKTSCVTMHTKTAIYVAELLTNAKFEVKTFDNHSIIECEGVGLTT